MSSGRRPTCFRREKEGRCPTSWSGERSSSATASAPACCAARPPERASSTSIAVPGASSSSKWRTTRRLRLECLLVTRSPVMLYDLRISIRQLLRKPAFTLAMIATLALGIGANSAIFSLINAVLLEPLPYANPDRLVRIWGRTTKPDIPRLLASEGEVLDYQQKFSAFEAVAAYAFREGNLTSGGEPERVRIFYTTSQIWKVLGV